MCAQGNTSYGSDLFLPEQDKIVGLCTCGGASVPFAHTISNMTTRSITLWNKYRHSCNLVRYFLTFISKLLHESMPRGQNSPIWSNQCSEVPRIGRKEKFTKKEERPNILLPSPSETRIHKARSAHTASKMLVASLRTTCNGCCQHTRVASWYFYSAAAKPIDWLVGIQSLTSLFDALEHSMC